MKGHRGNRRLGLLILTSAFGGSWVIKSAPWPLHPLGQSAATLCRVGWPYPSSMKAAHIPLPRILNTCFNFKLWHPRCVLITVYKEWY